MADLWKDGTRFIGLKARDFGIGSVSINTAETLSEFSVEDDANSLALDNIVYKEGNGSIYL